MSIGNIAALHQAIAAVCPIEGVDSNGGISFASGATDAQKVAAQAIATSWVDPTPIRIASAKSLIQAMNAAGNLPAFIAALAAAKASDRVRWSSYDDVPENNPVFGRICAAASPPIVVSALYDATT